jgi:hypothetical protein
MNTPKHTFYLIFRGSARLSFYKEVAASTYRASRWRDRLCLHAEYVQSQRQMVQGNIASLPFSWSHVAACLCVGRSPLVGNWFLKYFFVVRFRGHISIWSKSGNRRWIKGVTIWGGGMGRSLDFSLYKFSLGVIKTAAKNSALTA